MKPFLLGISLVLVTSTVMTQEVSEIILEQPPFRAYSAFWPNLHHVLWAEAWARRPPSAEKPAGSLPEPLTANLTEDERRAWETAVAYYDDEVADLNLLFEMGPIRKLLMTAQGNPPVAGLPPAHRKALAAAAPVYRKHW